LTDTIIVGICGGSGSGKTTFSLELTKYYGSCAAYVSQDSYYIDRRGISNDEMKVINFDHPESVSLDELASDIINYKAGAYIDVPVYCFESHTRKNESLRIHPANVLVTEGIYLFHNKKLRDSIDIKIYLDVPDDIRLIRRIRRDMEQRGRALDSILEQYEHFVRPMYESKIQKQRKYADHVLNMDSPDAIKSNLDQVINAINTLFF
jgi:uridine kinase